MSAFGRRSAVGSGGSSRRGRKNQPSAMAQTTRKIEMASVAALLDVQVADELGVFLDEPAALLDYVTHQRLEQRGCLQRVLHRHLDERAAGAINRGDADDVRVHLAQPLVAPAGEDGGCRRAR